MSASGIAHAADARKVPSGEYILRGGYVLTMDSSLGEFPVGDVHVKDGKIVAVAARIVAPHVRIVDASHRIVMPGFVDTHQHLWTSLLRGSLRGDDPMFGYFPSKARAGAVMTPEDFFHSVRFGVAQNLASGITTVHDFCHNVPSPAHADADMQALEDLGVRARFSYGRFGEPSTRPMDWQDVERVRQTLVPKRSRLTLGVVVAPTTEKDGSMRQNVFDDLSVSMAHAQAMQLPYTLHYGNLTHGIIEVMDKHGWLNSNLLLVHPQGFKETEREMLAASNVNISIAPIIELQYSTVRSGYTQFAEMEALHAQMGISIDSSAASANANFFNEMRALLWAHKSRGAHVPLTPRRLVELATIDGARTLNLAERTGSLTPGKQADILLVRMDALDIAPVFDPFNALVYSAQPDHVDTVIVDGRVLRQGGKFVSINADEIIRDATRSAVRLRKEAGLA
ncbi:amidohydrolase family protein [Pandoraea fibrosis]|uniref:Amidohydrolase family protein n=2 Tax=Pandoraea fibrosis TaxID=1891094 RepID=A0ABX6HYD5_9BURK|nr:amidohydrolase family protein [Pandoraea fibrosis]QHF15490.1 amidohydrolase family protein [Pandoraea fibrosis]